MRKSTLFNHLKISVSLLFLWLVFVSAVAADQTSTLVVLPKHVIFKNGRYKSKIDGAEMVLVPAGAFVMGSNSGHYSEKPARKVFLSHFLIDIHEVSNIQFDNFVKDSGYSPQGPWKRGYGIFQGDHPARFVTWHDAAAYAKWARRALPTEAQWEKAARGQRAFVYPWGNKFEESHVPSKFSPVGSFPEGKSPYGALDMAGNVWEWVADWYDRFYYQSFKSWEVVVDPLGPEDGAPPEKKFLDSKTAAGNERSSLKVIRGGGMKTHLKESARTSKRMWGNPSYWFNDTGFRCALPVKLKRGP